jgi:predicted PurR-regulated permease PerM
MKQILKYVGYILLIAIVGFMIWRFWYLMVWVLIAAVLSFVGHPFVQFFDGLHIKKWKFPHSLSALLSLVILVLLFLGFLSIFVPLIVKQADTISKIDVNKLAENLQGPLQWIDNQLHAFGVIPADQTLQDFIILKAKSLVNLGSVTTLVSNFFSVAGTVFIGLFAILFIAFFFLKDENMFEQGLFLLVPVKHHQATHEVITDSKHLLKRYFIGIILEVFGVMTIIALGLWIFGIENALLIGFFGGIMNIIPYLGPIIGSAIALTLGLTATLASGTYPDLLPVLLKLSGVLLGANFIDNNILVPLIYSKSVKSHPLEIFFVIIMAGNLGGLLGMLVAVPVYTVLRVIAREFFQQFRVVQKLTESMDQA